MALQNSKESTPLGGGFETKYSWQPTTSVVILQHVHGAQIRPNPVNHAMLCHKGGQGDWAKWHVHVDEEYNTVRLQSYKTRKYVAVAKNKEEFGVDDYGSKYSYLRPVALDDGVQLESHARPGIFLSVKPHEGVVAERRDHPSNKLLAFTCGQAKTLFMKPFTFQEDGVVIIRHPHEGGIAVIGGKLSDRGTREPHSQWMAIVAATPGQVQFRHEETGKYLAICEGKSVELVDEQSENTRFKVGTITEPNIVRLESALFEGSYIDVRADGVMVGKGGPHSQMTILRKQ